MKKLLCIIALFVLGMSLSSVVLMQKNKVYAQESQSITILDQNDYRLTSDYLDLFGISNAKFSVKNNGGELAGNELSKAFDRNFSTCFKSSQDNNVSYTDADGIVKPNFINYIDIEFDCVVNLDRVMYGTENAGTTRGYPTKLNIYYYTENCWNVAGKYTSASTTSMVIFNFGQTISTNKIRFEYEQVDTRHKYVATAREIICLQPESENEYEDFSSLLNYNYTSVNEKFNTLEKLNNFENLLKTNVNYDSLLKPKIVRAREILLGNIVFDARREFSTDSNSQNTIAQNGNIVSYIRNTLKMTSFGTNRQVTGICVRASEVLTIYVDADEDDVLPQICFTQNHGHWTKWLSSNYQLFRGKNTFVVPYLKNDNYTIDTIDGGAVYIVNPYTSDEQSSNVKLYFENGEFYPVYRKGDDENVFKNQLNDYYSQLQSNPQDIMNITEIVTDHVIFSGTASGAYNTYKSYSPKQATIDWDIYMEKLLAFGGVELNPSGTNYDVKNQYINVNVRVSQPWASAAAYAASEHIGIYTSWEGVGYTAKNFGWGMSHEIGHTFDIAERILSECTNNMWSKYNETAIEKTATRGDFLKTTLALSSDYANTTEFFNTNRLNYLIWWNIEAYQKGFWGKLENCYRGLDENLVELLKNDQFKTNLNTLNKTEKMVLYSSIALNVDLSYYYERWGFNADTSEDIFSYSNSTQNFKDCLLFAINSGYIDNTKQPKLWYYDAKQYNYESAGVSYSLSDDVSIKNVFKVSSGYSILLDSVQNPNHLGYEILQGDDTAGYKVVGFTYDNYFVDTTTYADGYTPSYKVRAVDRQLNYTNYSPSKTIIANQEYVCKIGDVFYSSLAEALENSQDGDTIILLKSTCETNMTLSKTSTETTKTITIQIAQNSTEKIVISKIESGNLITINSGCVLNILGLENNHIVIDGGNFLQTGCLINVGGTFNANYVDFSNSLNSGNGGAINSLGGTIILTDCAIENNLATNGGGVYINYASTRATLSSVSFKNNQAGNGSAIASKGTIDLTNCELLYNTATESGTIYNYAGGVVYLKNSNIHHNSAKNGGAMHLDGYTEITNSTLLNNNATNNGGAVFYSTTVSARKVMITNSTFENSSLQGSEIFVNAGTMELTSSTFNSGSIYLNAGNLTISADCDVVSKLYVSSNANLTLKTGLFVNYENCVFYPLNFQSNMVLLQASGFNLTQNDLNSTVLNTDLLTTNLNENKLILVPKQVTLTILLGDNTLTKTYNYGENVTLNFEVESTKYIAKFVDNLNNEYAVNSQIVLTDNLTLTGEIANKLKIDFVYDSGTESVYIKPYEQLVMPTESSFQRKIVAWIGSKASFSPSEKVYLNTNTTLTAQYEKLFKITLVGKDEEVIDIIYSPYNNAIDLPKLSDKHFSGWTLNDTKVDNTLIVTGDLELVAQYNKADIQLIVLVCVLIVGIIIVAIIITLSAKSKKKKHIINVKDIKKS